MNILSGSPFPVESSSVYRDILLLRYCLLFDRLANRVPEATDIVDAARNQLLPLDELSGEQLEESGSPFFWLNVCRSYDERLLGREAVRRTCDYLVATAFDSYFSGLREGASVTLATPETDVVLPVLGIHLRDAEGGVTLVKENPETLLIRSSGGERQVTLQSSDKPLNGICLNIACTQEVRLLLTDSPSLFEDEYRGNLAPNIPNPERLAEMISAALKVIALADQPLHERTAKFVKWYVPMAPASLQSHTSFAAKNLVGAIFLSEACSDLVLAEVILHEFHHNELFAYAETVDLVDHVPSEKYYSPWREDARPLYGLLHGLYVFTGVADFYRALESQSDFKHFAEEFRGRRYELLCQLAVGFQQVPEARLKPAGADLIRSIGNRVENHMGEFPNFMNSMPGKVADHLNRWKQAHADLQLSVVTPLQN
jgi:HEXXH motif-containing protein